MIILVHENEMSTYLQELLKSSNTMNPDNTECLNLNLSPTWSVIITLEYS
jgi:hypothetical protein